MSKEEILRAEKEEEAKLKAKYPAVRPGPQLLQKRMQKGVSKFSRSFQVCLEIHAVHLVHKSCSNVIVFLATIIVVIDSLKIFN